MGSRRRSERRSRRSSTAEGSAWNAGDSARRRGKVAWLIMLRLFYANLRLIVKPPLSPGSRSPNLPNPNPKSPIPNTIPLMPELPEVEVLRRSLEPHLVGDRIVRVEVRNPALREPVETA